MKLKPISSEKAYDEMLEWVDQSFDNLPEVGTTEGDKLHIALLLIKDFEDKNYSIPFPNPIEAVKIRMIEKGLKNKDLIEWIGSKGYVSSILSGRKPMTLRIAKILHEKLNIPAEVILST